MNVVAVVFREPKQKWWWWCSKQTDTCVVKTDKVQTAKQMYYTGTNLDYMSYVK